MFRKLITYFVLIIFFPAGNLFGQEEGDWKLRKQKNGIEIFSIDSEISAFESFKATMTITGTVETFVAALQDLEAMPEWAYSVKYARLLEKSGDTIQIYYSEASAPFPFSNRDGIYLNRFLWNSKTKSLTVEIELLHDYLPVGGNLVRVKGSGFWQVSMVGNGKLDITFQMQVDPGGNIPAWLANLFTDETPYQSLVNLREMMKKEKYQQMKFGFIN